MRFSLDENLSHLICNHLRAADHDAVHVAEVGLACTDDDVIMQRARADDRVLVSCDHDFVQLLFATGASRPSLILTRDVDTLTAAQTAALMLDALSSELQGLLTAGAIATLNTTQVRVRPLPLVMLPG